MKIAWTPAMHGADADAVRSQARQRPGRLAVTAASSMLLCAAVALLVSHEAGAPAPGRRGGGAGFGERFMLEEIMLQGNANASNSTTQATQDLAQAKPRLSFYEEFMERLANLNANSSEALSSTKCQDDDEDCIPAEATRVSALQITGNLADDWVVRNPHDYHPYQFCAEYSDLTAKELRTCLTHLMKALELARSEPIAHNGTNASLELAAETNHTFNVSEEGGWDACYEAFEYPEDKNTCINFVSNKLEGDIAYACTRLDTPEQRFKCKRVTAAVSNVKALILRQEVVTPELSNVMVAKEQDRAQAMMEMRHQENLTEMALQKMSPELKKMLQKTIDISDESNDELTGMEQAINETLLVGPQTVLDRLGPKPGPFGELPGKEEHDYMVAKALAANLSATAAAAEAAAAHTSVDAAKAEMRAIIKRGYNGAGDSTRALRLMKAPVGTAHTQAAAQVPASPAVDQATGGAKRATLRAVKARSNAAHTETLLQVGGGMHRAQFLAGRLQGLEQLEKLATHGNLGNLDSIMDGLVQAPQEGVSDEQVEEAKIAAAFGEDGSNFLHNQNEGGNSNADMHVPPSSAWKSAADVATQFNTDSVPNLANLADDDSENMADEDSENMGNDLIGDLGNVMDGTAAIQTVTPSREMRQAAAIAQGFNADGRLAGKLASSWMGSDKIKEVAPDTYSFDKSFVHIYKKLMSNGNAGTQRIKLLRTGQDTSVPSGALPINANSVQQALEPMTPESQESTRQAWLKRWLQKTRDQTDAADGQSMIRPAVRMPTDTSQRTVVASASDTHEKDRQGLPSTPVTTKVADQANDMNNLWNKLLNEEAMAKAAKYEAKVAKDHAVIAARKIEEREAERRKQASEREEVKLRADEARVEEDKHEAAAARKRADEAAHLLAKHKFLEMQAAKNKARQQLRQQEATHEAAIVMVERVQQQAAQRQLAATRQAAIKAGIEKKIALEQEAKAKEQEAAATAFAKETAKSQQTARSSQQQVSTSQAKQIVPGRNAAAARAPVTVQQPADTQDREAIIVATVKRLEQNAEREPVITKQEREEQRDEVEEAKKLLEQAAMLKKTRAVVRQRRPEMIATEENEAQAAPPIAVARMGAPERKGLVSAATQAEPFKDFKSPAQSRHNVKNQVQSVLGKASTVAPDGIGSAPRVRALVLAPRAIAAPVPAPAPARPVQPSTAVKPAPAAATSAPAKESSLSKAEKMEVRMKKEDAEEEAKVSDLVKSFSHAEDDGMGGGNILNENIIGGGVKPANTQQVSYAADRQATMAQINALSKQASSADSDGSNLGDLMSIMAAPPVTNIAAAFHPFGIASHHHLATIQAEKKLFDDATHKGPMITTGVSAEAEEIKEMNAKEEKQIKKMPGADAMNQLKTLDAKIKKTRQGMKDHMAKEKLYKKEAEQAQDHMAKLEGDNSGMFGLIGALEAAGSAGGALGSIIASGLSQARKPGAKAPDVAKAFSKVWKANMPSASAPTAVAK